MNVHVMERLVKWLRASEGPVPYLYVDNGYKDKKTGEVKGRLVTVGIGFMIDPIRTYLGEFRGKFQFANGTVADDPAIIKEFDRVADLGKNQGVFGHLNFKPSAQLFLTEAGMAEMLKDKLAQKERALKVLGSVKEFYKEFDKFPPDAQMGCVSRAFGRISDDTPRDKAFNRSVQAQDWRSAALNCVWRDWTAEKNGGHQLMFENAQAYVDAGQDGVDLPFFPGRFSVEAGTMVLQTDDPRGHPYKQDIW
jgi:hypothetical protein